MQMRAPAAASAPFHVEQDAETEAEAWIEAVLHLPLKKHVHMACVTQPITAKRFLFVCTSVCFLTGFCHK